MITALNRDGTDRLGTRSVAIEIVDESLVSGSLLTVEGNHFCILLQERPRVRLHQMPLNPAVLDRDVERHAGDDTALSARTRSMPRRPVGRGCAWT